MFRQQINKFYLGLHLRHFLPQQVLGANLAQHTPTCPTQNNPCAPKEPRGNPCKPAGSTSDASPAASSSGGGGVILKRAEFSGKCRMGFIPDEWFTFFHVKTGVSGFYLFLLTVGNYCVSKEILVMEHEYYGGLSWFVVLYLVSTRLGPKIGASLDKQVDAVVEEFEVGRKEEAAACEATIQNCKDAQMRAEGQKLLMDAKKENILMQLEAIYRERSMEVYKMVKSRMDYQVKRYYAEARVQQKWMIDWILKSVMQSITADFEQQALNQAIKDLEKVAARA